LTDDLGNLNIDELNDIGEIADNMAINLAQETVDKLRNLKGKVKNERQKILSNFKQRKAVLDKYMQTAPFTRLVDKLTFMFGVLILMMTCFLMGKYPNDQFYVWHTTLVSALVIYRIKMYYELKYHYYLFDFCYFANVLITLFHLKYPENEALLYINFMYSTGPLALAIGAFRNSLVFHSVDMLTSLAIHAIPMISAWNFRWVTLPQQ
jgi:hypothetical protein